MYKGRAASCARLERTKWLPGEAELSHCLAPNSCHLMYCPYPEGGLWVLGSSQGPSPACGSRGRTRGRR